MVHKHSERPAWGTHRTQYELHLLSTGGVSLEPDLVIDDQAPAPFTNDPLRSGVYRPANRFDTIEDSFPAPASNTSNVALSTFSGINPNGTWKLYLVDDNGDDDGAILGGWSLIIKARARV